MFEISIRKFFVSKTDETLTVVPHLSFVVHPTASNETVIKYIDLVKSGLAEMVDDFATKGIDLRLMTSEEVKTYREQEGITDDDIGDEDDEIPE